MPAVAVRCNRLAYTVQGAGEIQLYRGARLGGKH
jgi:hypothetical protein